LKEGGGGGEEWRGEKEEWLIRGACKRGGWRRGEANGRNKLGREVGKRGNVAWGGGGDDYKDISLV
jgi:hypothetical protein